MRILLLLSAMCFFTLSGLSAQDINGRTLRGTIIDDDGEPVIGATVSVKGSTIGTVSDLDGTYELTVPEAATSLVFSFVGFTTVELPITGADRIDAVLAEGAILDEIVFVGSRAAGRTKLTTTVPVDVVDVRAIASASAQTNVNQLLNYVAPSFSSNTQTISDGTDHIDPASLRGLGPDQVLVLINGKRRHNTSLVNVNGTFGRGAVGTDLNSIPVAAIERIEILRDGASAQYGSDAIAGSSTSSSRTTSGSTSMPSPGRTSPERSPSRTATSTGNSYSCPATTGSRSGTKAGSSTSPAPSTTASRPTG